eukprot:scaffold194134_cov21-Tisochrysis_lutea.AAC.1
MFHARPPGVHVRTLVSAPQTPPQAMQVLVDAMWCVYTAVHIALRAMHALVDAMWCVYTVVHKCRLCRWPESNAWYNVEGVYSGLSIAVLACQGRHSYEDWMRSDEVQGKKQTRFETEKRNRTKGLDAWRFLTRCRSWLCLWFVLPAQQMLPGSILAEAPGERLFSKQLSFYAPCFLVSTVDSCHFIAGTFLLPPPEPSTALH